MLALVPSLAWTAAHKFTGVASGDPWAHNSAGASNSNTKDHRDFGKRGSDEQKEYFGRTLGTVHFNVLRVPVRPCLSQLAVRNERNLFERA